MIDWRSRLGTAGELPIAWQLDLNDPTLRGAALALAPGPRDLARAATRPPAERQDVLARRGLVRICVGAALGLAPEGVALAIAARGGPRLEPPLGDLHLSFAWRRGHFACALARSPVGIDLELPDDGEIPWNLLHRQEIAALEAARPSERQELFSRIWTAKEAFVKATGEGLRRDTRSFAVRVFHQEAGEVRDPARPSPIPIVYAPSTGGCVVALALLSG